MKHDLSKLFTGGKNKPAFSARLTNTGCGKPLVYATDNAEGLGSFVHRNQPKKQEK
jgi:hypothetical protein